MLRSQPDFEVCKRTIPVKYLNDESKGKARDMEDFYSPASPPNTTQKEKDDP